MLAFVGKAHPDVGKSHTQREDLARKLLCLLNGIWIAASK